MDVGNEKSRLLQVAKKPTPLRMASLYAGVERIPGGNSPRLSGLVKLQGFHNIFSASAAVAHTHCGVRFSPTGET